MGRLGVAMDRMVQRASGEIHTLVDTTLDEVDSRVELRREEAVNANTKPSNLVGTTILALSLDVVGPPHHAAILRDLFWTLYSKLVAVLEGHRVTYEIARGISAVSEALIALTAAPRVPRRNAQRIRHASHTRRGDLQANAGRGE